MDATPGLGSERILKTFGFRYPQTDDQWILKDLQNMIALCTLRADSGWSTWR